MKVIEFYDWMMPYVSHREKIFLNKDGSVYVWCGFEAGSGKHLFYIGDKSKDCSTMKNRILKMRRYY